MISQSKLWNRIGRTRALVADRIQQRLRNDRRRFARRKPAVPSAVEVLEDRTLLAVFNIADGDIADLRAAIIAANGNTEVDTINLAANGTYSLSATGRGEDAGATGDLDITASELLTINGNGSTIAGNSIDRVLHVLGTGNLTLNNVRIIGGSVVDGDGGGIQVESGGQLTLDNSTIQNNDAQGTSGTGGGLNNEGTATITGSTISSNIGELGGGLITGANSTTTIQSSTIFGNTASRFGGGVYLRGAVTISDSVVSGNSALNDGGGLYIFSNSDVALINSTVSGNSARRDAGGISNSGRLTMTNSTVTGNTADTNISGDLNPGGGIHSLGTETLINSIVAGNFRSTNAFADDISGTINAAFNTLIGASDSAGGIMDGQNGNIVGNSGTGTIDINTVLDTMLLNNGGPTETHALVANSPAINAGDDPLAVDGMGNPLANDQRGTGFRRVSGTSVDMGAFEVAGMPSAVINSPTGTTESGDITINFDVADSVGNPVTLEFEWSIDNGATFFDATAAASSSFPNPDPNRATPISGGTFVWDSVADGVRTENIVFRVVVDNGVNFAEGRTIFIVDNPLTFSVSDVTQAEGDSGDTAFTFTVMIDNAQNDDVTFDFAVLAGTADAADFGGTLPSGSGTITAGNTSTTVTVNVSGDNTVEADETFQLDITNTRLGGTPILPAPITELGAFDTPGVAVGVQVVGGTAYVAVGSSGLRVLDVSDPTNIAELGAFNTPDFAQDVQVVGGTAYVAGGFSGLRVLDVSDPTNITELGFFDTPGTAFDVQVVGGTAYVADFSSGLRVLDVSDPANITELGFFNTPDFAQDVQVVGSTAYVADNSSGLRVLDVSDPTNITELGFFDTPGQAFGVQVVGSIAYVADFSSGLRVLDVSDPTNITELGAFDTPGDAFGVQVVGSTAYVADDSSGLRVLDVSDPTNIIELADFDTPGDARAAQVVGGTAYVANLASGLRVLNIPPNQLSATGTITNDDAVELSIDDVTLVEGDSGDTAFTFTVSLDQPALTDVTFDFTTNAGTATAGTDFTAISGNGTIAAGQTSTTVTVNVNGDATVEAEETFFVDLSNVQGANLTDGRGLGTITNDDAATLSIDDVTVFERNSGTSQAIFTVTLDTAINAPFTVDFAANDGTATAGSDYTAFNGTLNFAGNAGETQTISVDITGDNVFEPDEQFSVDLSNLQAAGLNVTIGVGTGAGRIQNDDLRANQATFATNPIPTVSISGGLATLVSGNFDGTPTDATDDIFFWDPVSGANRILFGDANRTQQDNPVDPTLINGNDFTEVLVGDFDGGGNSDLFFWNPTTGRNRLIHFNGGTGSVMSTFETNVIDPTQINGNDFTTAVVADLDGIDEADLFFWNPTSGRNRIAHFLHVTAGVDSDISNVQDNVIDPTQINGGDFQSVHVGQFETGGLDELLFLNLSSGNNRRTSFTGAGGTTAVDMVRNGNAALLNGAVFDTIEIADLNGDGLDDIFAWNPSNGQNRTVLTDIDPATPPTFVDNALANGGINGDYEQVVRLVEDVFSAGPEDDLFFWNPTTGANRIGSL